MTAPAEDDVKRRLRSTLWGADPAYYDAARAHVLEAASEGGEYGWLRSHLPAMGRVLELGCGEGSNMEVLRGEGRTWFGCDLSELAVRRAAARGARVVVADAERLPFPAGSFSAVLAISVVEHLPDPGLVLTGAVDALAPSGRILVLSPQYGGPLGASPCRDGGGVGRFVRRFVAAHGPGPDGTTLAWERVEPAVLSGRKYDGDLDTVVEPELRSLVRFLERRGLRIVDARSGYPWRTWRIGRQSPGQRLVRALLEPVGRLGLPPYRRFGPLVAVCAERPSATPIP